jgi:transcriptional regulator with XRE-family HTH domain
MATRKRTEKKVEPEDFLTPYLGPIILGLRRKRRMTQKELAKASGIHETTLGKIESGEGRVRPDLAESLCSVLGESTDEIIARAIEDMKLDYSQKKPLKKVSQRPLQEEDPLQESKEKIRDKHEELIRAGTELREAIFEWSEVLLREKPKR